MNKTDRTMTLFDWTLDQWARACAVLGRKIETKEDAVSVLREWHSKWKTAPIGEQIIEGVDKEMDYDSARTAFTCPEFWP